MTTVHVYLHDANPVVEAARRRLEQEVKIASQRLKSVKGVGSGAQGTTPDDVKNSAEYKSAKKSYGDAFHALRRFNSEHER